MSRKMQRSSSRSRSRPRGKEASMAQQKQSHIARSELDSSCPRRPSAHPHFRWKKGMILARGRYELRSRLGDGTFGRVLAAKDLQTGDFVAIKVGKAGDDFCEQAVEEAEMLQYIQRLDTHRKRLCVRLLDSFLEPPQHFCMVFEQLGISLRDFLKRNNGCGLFLEDLRSIAHQLLQGLAGLHAAGVIHTDLKCRNVMLRDAAVRVAPHPREPGKEALRPMDCSISIIDFGSAIKKDEAFRGRAGTRQFRSPEVALGLLWDEKSDIWSAGCIIAMLYTGTRPFSVHDNQEHLAMMERFLEDRFPQHMLRTARQKWADQDEASSDLGDVEGFAVTDENRLDWPGEAQPEAVRRVEDLRPLSAKVLPRHGAFLSLLQGLLQLDPQCRMDAATGCNASFFLSEVME
ncbi:AFC3 [Symbiodinium natans]|uniref:AFC3 protein n=1 Tax=Symbiodinium natans TaxID=878477 RepID=A0A812LGI8_9DINO|nr:AFC3 [Symbiodinium natans]